MLTVYAPCRLRKQAEIQNLITQYLWAADQRPPLDGWYRSRAVCLNSLHNGSKRYIYIIVIRVSATDRPCGSQSMRRTFFPACAKQTPKLNVAVVFPPPPFWLAIAITLHWFTEFSPFYLLWICKRVQKKTESSFRMLKNSVLAYLCIQFLFAAVQVQVQK